MFHIGLFQVYHSWSRECDYRNMRFCEAESQCSSISFRWIGRVPKRTGSIEGNRDWDWGDRVRNVVSRCTNLVFHIGSHTSNVWTRYVLIWGNIR